MFAFRTTKCALCQTSKVIREEEWQEGTYSNHKKPIPPKGNLRILVPEILALAERRNAKYAILTDLDSTVCFSIEAEVDSFFDKRDVGYALTGPKSGLWLMGCTFTESCIEAGLRSPAPPPYYEPRQPSSVKSLKAARYLSELNLKKLKSNPEFFSEFVAWQEKRQSIAEQFPLTELVASSGPTYPDAKSVYTYICWI